MFDWQRFVEQSGGVKAGWDEYDHSTFMKYRIKHKVLNLKNTKYYVLNENKMY